LRQVATKTANLSALYGLCRGKKHDCQKTQTIKWKILIISASPKHWLFNFGRLLEAHGQTVRIQVVCTFREGTNSIDKKLTKLSF